MTLLLALTVGAQEKKSWMFQDGLSDETIANLNADAANWSANGTDSETGETNNWKNAVKQSADGYWMANGQVIEELRGLKIDIGSNKDNSVHLATTKLRLTRKNTKITFPKLANGQKITIQGRSANSTATNRGIKPVQSYIEFQAEESSPQTGGACIFLGSQAEGSEGTYTFVWKVVTESTDSVDVQFQLTPDAGIDFTYFMIDQGDAPEVEGAKNVAYIGSADDNAFNLFDASVVNATVAESVPTLEELMTNYDALVVGSTATEEQLKAVKDIIAFFPVVNINPALYALYDVSTAVAEGELTVTDDDLFNGKDAIEHSADITAVTLSGYFADDKVLASAGEAAAIHVHNVRRNAYYYIPLNAKEESQDLYDLLTSAITAAAKTKKELAQVGKPVISFTQTDGLSTVTITAQNSKTIYYTTDGTEPTTASTMYAEPFDLTAATTVKAFATGDGFTDSEIGSKEVTIAYQLAQPTITIAREQGKSTVTITAAEGASVHFNFDGSKTAKLSQAYTEPIVLTEPATIYALATAEGSLDSELASQFVGIDGVDASNIRLDIITHFDANQTDWLPEGQKLAFYLWGNSAWNYYSTEVDHEETVKASDGVTDSTVYYYKPDAEALKIHNPNSDNGWVIKSKGQVLTLEGETPAAGVGNGDVQGEGKGHYAEEAIDQIPAGLDKGATKGLITFGKKISGEPYTGSIETTTAYAGPFDIIVYCSNGNSNGKADMEIQISTDGETWTKLADINVANKQRYIRRTKISYEETTPVYLRATQTGGSEKAQVYDIYLLNNGEQSKQYSEETAGVSTVQNVTVRQAAVYSINGTRLNSMKRGLNIVVDENGKARKVLVK
jgi:hypothetical protein